MRLHRTFSICAFTLLPALAAPEPTDPIELYRTLLESGEAAKWATAIPRCISLASKDATEGGPFHALLKEYLARPDPVERRVAIVEGLLMGAPETNRPYAHAFELLEAHLGDPSVAFRPRLRDAIVRLVEGDEGAREARVAILVERLAGTRSRSALLIDEVPRHARTVEDLAWILWSLDPAGAVNALVAGLRAAEGLEGDPLRYAWSAPFHWTLRIYLFRREIDAKAWAAWWEKHRDSPLLGLSHAERALLEEWLLEDWKATNDLLRDALPAERYRSWLLGKLRSPLPSVQERAARAAGSFAARISREKGDRSKALLEPLFAALDGIAGGSPPYVFEPPSVRAASLGALQGPPNDAGFAPFAADERAVTLLKNLFDDPFPRIRLGAVRAAGALRVPAVLPRVFNLLENPDRLADGRAAVKAIVTALGAIGVTPDSPNPTPRALVDGLAAVFRKAWEARADPEARDLAVECVKSLGQLGASGEVDAIRTVLVEEALRPAASAQDPAADAVFSRVILSLGDLQDEAALPELAKILAERARYRPPDVQKAVWAVEAIAGKSPEAARKALEVLVPHLNTPELTENVQKRVVFLCRGAPDRVEGVLAQLAAINAPDRIVALYETETFTKVLSTDRIPTADEARLRQLWSCLKIVIRSYEKLDRWGPGIEVLDRVATALEKNGLPPKLRAVIPAAELDVLTRALRTRQAFAAALSAGDHAKASAALVELFGLDAKRHLPWAKARIAALAKGKKEFLTRILNDEKIPEPIKQALGPLLQAG